MPRARPGRWGALLALLLLLACHRTQYAVVETDVVPSLWPQELGAGDVSELRRVWNAQLAGFPALQQVADPKKVADHVPRYQLVFSPTLLGTPEKGGAVIATVLLRRELDGLSARYPVEAEVRFEPSSTGAPVKLALEHATAQALDGTRLQIAALEAKPDTLREQLRSKDARVRGFALGRLAELRDPAAEPALRAALKSDDLDEVRRAMGGLVSLGSADAVPAIIDAAQHKPPEFQREVIYALEELGGAEAEGYLYTLSEGADLEPIRAAAHEALQELQARHDAHDDSAAHHGRSPLRTSTSQETSR